MQAIEELSKNVDTLITIPNDKLLDGNNTSKKNLLCLSSPCIVLKKFSLLYVQ